MAKSLRVISGSQTKGSKATPSGSIIYSYQGINAKTNESYFGSLLPRLGSGDRTALFLNNKRLPKKTFDDTLTIGGAASLTSPSGSVVGTTNRVQQRINFRYENRNLGQIDQRPEGYEFVDTVEYDPVAYLQDQSQTMWPVNLFNSDMVPKYEFDGVIEPLEIRSEMLGLLDTRYEGHSVRGAVIGEFAEGPLGSQEIKWTWAKTDRPQPPFLDAPDLFAVSVVEQDISQGGTVQPVSMQPFQSLDVTKDYPYVERDYRNDVYSSVWSHNPLVFSQSMVPLNWNYTLTGSWMTRRDARVYSSSGSLVFHFRFGSKTIPLVSSSATGGPGATGRGQIFSANAGIASGPDGFALTPFSGSFPANGRHPNQMFYDNFVPLVISGSGASSSNSNSYYPVGPPDLQVNASRPTTLTTGSFLFGRTDYRPNSSYKVEGPSVVYIGGGENGTNSSFPNILSGSGITFPAFTMSTWVYPLETTIHTVMQIGATDNALPSGGPYGRDTPGGYNNIAFCIRAHSTIPGAMRPRLEIGNGLDYRLSTDASGRRNYIAATARDDDPLIWVNQWNHIVYTFSGQWASGSFARGGWSQTSGAENQNRPVKMWVNGVQSAIVLSSNDVDFAPNTSPSHDGELNIPPGAILTGSNFAIVGAKSVSADWTNKTTTTKNFPFPQFSLSQHFQGYISEVALWDTALNESDALSLYYAVSGTMSTRTIQKSYHIPWYYGDASGSFRSDQPGAWSSLVDGKYPDFKYEQPSRQLIISSSGLNATATEIADGEASFAYNNILWLRFNSEDQARPALQPWLTSSVGGSGLKPNVQCYIADKSGNQANALWVMSSSTGYASTYPGFTAAATFSNAGDIPVLNTSADYKARFVTTTPKDASGNSYISDRAFQFNGRSYEVATVTKLTGSWNDVWGNTFGSTADGTLNTYYGYSTNVRAYQRRGAYPERPATLAFWMYVDEDIRTASHDPTTTDFTVIQIGSEQSGAASETKNVRINVFVDGDGKMGLKIERATGGNAYFIRFQNCITPNQWYHVVFSQRHQMWANYSPGGGSPGNQRPFYCYINGEEAVDVGTGEPNYYASFPPITKDYFPYGDINNVMLIGGRDVTGVNRKHAFKGKLTDVCMWNYELQRDTIRALYFAVSGSVQLKQGNTVFGHNSTAKPGPLRAGIEMFNSASHRETTDPLQVRANHGFYFGQKAGSIVYGDE